MEMIGWTVLQKKQHSFGVYRDADSMYNGDKYTAPVDPLLEKINVLFWWKWESKSRRFELASRWVSKEYNFWIYVLGTSVPSSFFQWEKIFTDTENIKKAQEDFEFFYENMKHDINHSVSSNVVYEITPDNEHNEIIVKLYPFLPSDITVKQEQIWQCQNTVPEYSIAPNLILAGSTMILSQIQISLSTDGEKIKVPQYTPITKYYTWKYTYIDAQTGKTKSIPAVFPYYEYSFPTKNLKKNTSYLLDISYNSRPQESLWIYLLNPILQYDPHALEK